MKAFKRMILPVACLALIMTSAMQARAQAKKPMAVLSVTSLDTLFASVAEIADVAGFAQQYALVDPSKSPITKKFLQGIDTTKPSGLAVHPGAGQIPDVIGFVPVKNIGDFVKTLQDAQLTVKKTGEGTYEMQFGFFLTLHIKNANGYAFIATNKDSLAKAPANPAALLNGLDKKYAYAVQINVQAIPAKMRASAQQSIGQIMDIALANPDIDEKFAKQMKANYERGVKMLLQETDSVTIGLGIDRQEKGVFLDFDISAVAGTSFAKQIAATSDVTTSFGGFDMANAGAVMTMTSKIAPEEVASSKAVLTVFGKKLIADLDADEDIEAAAKGPLKEFANSMLDLITKTVESGKIDAGAVAMASKNSIQVAIGGHVADGKALEAAVKKLIKVAQADKNFPPVKFNAAKHGDVTFHTSTFPVPGDDEDAQRILGKELQMALGIGPKAAYFAVGKDSVGLIKKIIDGSKAEAKKAAGFKLRASIGHIMNFVKSIDDDPTIATLAAAAAKANGKDNVIIAVGLEKNSVKYQIKIEQGVIRVIGAAAANALGG